MTVPWEGPPRREPPFPPGEKPDVSLFARIEGLVGEEDALLRIPAKDRTGPEHDRLRTIGDELDWVWEVLRRRAERREARPGGAR